MALDTSDQGLSSVEARARLARYGKNELPRADPPGVARIFLRQFANPLIYILLVAAAIAAATRNWSDAGFIVAVLLLNAAIGCVQKYGAEQSAQALRALSVSKAYEVWQANIPPTRMKLDSQKEE